MNFAARLVLVGLFGFTSVNQLFAQKSKVDAYELRVANPTYFRMYVCNFFLDDRVVNVALDDQSVLSGKIERIDAEEFSLASDSGPVEVRFDRVRRVSALAQRPSPASRAKKQASYFHTDKPKYIVRVKLRQNDRPLVGHVTKANELTFMLKEKESGVDRELDYRDVQRISPTLEESLVDGFNTTLLVLGFILLWPLAILTGMDC